MKRFAYWRGLRALGFLISCVLSTHAGAEDVEVVRSRVTQRFEIYNPHSEEHLRAIKQMGFTQVILDWPNLHSAATDLGLDVVMANWWTAQTDSDTLQKGIDYARRVDPRRLVAVSMMDEPERYAPDTPFSYYESLYIDLRDRFDKELPGVPLEISHWGPLPSWTASQYQSFTTLYRATDRIRLMPYPDLDEGPLSEVFYTMMRSRRLMELAGRELPQVVILQTWVLPEDPKLPTIDELRVMAYLAMLSGAETVSFFSYDPELWQKTPGFHAEFVKLMRELTEFSRRHQAATVEARLDARGVFAVSLSQPGRHPVQLVMNTNRFSVGDLAPLQIVTAGEQFVASTSRWSSPKCTRRRGILGRRL